MLRVQATFRKNDPSENHEIFSLQVVKSSIEYGTFLTGVQSTMQATTQTQTHTQHLYKMIHDHACEGCRLRCIEITGCHQAPDSHMNNPQSMGIDSGMAHGQNIEHSVYGVDLFFEIQQHQNPELYQYQAVPMKLNATFHATFFCGQQWELQMDWQGVMNHHLGSGWRLIEVFDDKSVDTSTSSGCCTITSSLALNVIFIFEKPQSRLNDNTKVYEGTMIEYQAPWSAAGFNSSMVMDTNWDGAIGDMGQHGWELVTILQTPATTTQTQFMSVKMTSLMWMFFQRRVVDTSMPLPIEDPTGMEPPAPILPTGIN